jgi:hypothetical protein
LCEIFFHFKFLRKALRKEARLGGRKVAEFHKHEYGPEVYNEETEAYYKICKTCDFKFEYEEL